MPLKRSPTLITLIVVLLYTIWILFLARGDPMAFVQLGTQFSQGDPEGTEGYDGQFVYYIALDPGRAPDKIDVPAYRFQRILYPLLARVLSLGNAALLPWILLGINLAAIVICVWLTERLLTQARVNIWYALPVGLYAGQFLSLRVDLPEPLGLVLVLGGVWLFERQRWLLSASLFSLAVLTKETMLISGGAYVLYLFTQKAFKQAIISGLIMTLPFGLYQIFLYNWLGHFGVGSGGAGATPFSLIPFGGLLEIAAISPYTFLVFLLILGPTIIWPSLWALWQTGRSLFFQQWRQWRQWHPWTIALALNALIIPFIPNSTYREPLAMLRFTLPLVAFIILYAAHIKHYRALRYSWLWLFTLAFLIQDPLL